jgi:hypothetical protein
MSYQATMPVSEQVGILHIGNIALQTIQLGFSVSTTGGSTIVAAPPSGFAIAVSQLFLNSTAAVTALGLYTSSGSLSTKVFTGGVSIAANGFFVLPYSPCPWIVCLSGDALNVGWTTSSTISGSVNYVLLPVPLPFP